MPLQTGYVQFQPAGAVGALANGEEFNAISRVCSVDLYFGAPAQRLGDNRCAPLAAGGEYIGVARRSQHDRYADRYGQYDTAGLVDEGVMWGLSGAAIVVGTQLNWDTTALRWTTAAASGTVILVPGAEADSAAGAANVLFKVRLRRVPS